MKQLKSFGTHWDNFKLVSYATVRRLIENLDDDLYNKLPEQLPPSKQPPKPKNSSSSASKASSSTATGATGTKLATIPPEDPLEEPGVWCEILKLEGRASNNRIADGFMWWLDKNMDGVVYEVNTILLARYLFVQK